LFLSIYLTDIIKKQYYDQPIWSKKFKNEHSCQEIEKKLGGLLKRVSFYPHNFDIEKKCI